MEGFSLGTLGSSPFPSYKDPDIGIHLLMSYDGTQSDDFDEDQRVIWTLDPINTLSSIAKNQLGHSDSIKMGNPNKDSAFCATEWMICLRLKGQDDDVRPPCIEWMSGARTRRDTAQ
ncbi:hypothetical protein sscle_15g104550 [Sclerotinia sclerotiorum 1980 UF-70]|uniref:Uncharacterized protein n=1 Tax=Sclerotinia sclerotiorum (strain ATCC 18683 / 1980 / Ss-1) TaxID=665079 RepID=A0A1D9QL62_SCLS1|nr:hypothetical protein sscle_15g104550 [Sclerotinia sclerotiorum 1980 UF-70]